MRLWFLAILLTLCGLASSKIEHQQESQEASTGESAVPVVIDSPPTSAESVIENDESLEDEEIHPEGHENNGEAKGVNNTDGNNMLGSIQSDNSNGLTSSEQIDEESEINDDNGVEQNEDKNETIEHEIEHEPEIEDRSNEEVQKETINESEDNEQDSSSIEEEIEEDPELPDESSEERDVDEVPVENKDSPIGNADGNEPKEEDDEEIEDENEVEDKSDEEEVEDKQDTEEDENAENEAVQQEKNSDADDNQAEPNDVDKSTKEEDAVDEGTDENVEPDVLETYQGNFTDDMSEDDIHAAIIAEAEKAFKVLIEKMEKDEEADNIRAEPKVGTAEEKNIDRLLASDAEQKDDAAVENAEKEAENSIVREIQNQIRLRRATDDPTEQPEGAKPIELPTETKDATGKNEALPVTIEKDAPKTETELQDLAEKKFTDNLGWIHYPWKKFPLLKSKLHYEKQCGCEVIWIKKVYTRPRPKSKLVLVHSSYIDLNKHHHHAAVPCKKSPFENKVKQHRHPLGKHLAEKSWRNHLIMKKSVVRSGKRAYSKRFGKAPGCGSIKKKRSA